MTEVMICMDPQRKKIRTITSVHCDEEYFEKEGYPIKVMIWGCIAKGFKSPLLRIIGKMTAETYQKLLTDNQIIKKLDQRFGKFGYVFQQDGASPHRANSTKQFLAVKVTSLPDHLHWPASSPDLSVIEICWSIVKAKIDHTNVSSSDDLFLAAAQAWDSIPQQTIDLLIDSFDARLTAVAKIEGECLNGYKKLVRLYKSSIHDGDNYLHQIHDEATKIKVFTRRSKNFFIRLSRIDFNERQVNRNNYQISRDICNLLPNRIKQKTGLPKSPLTN